VPNVNAIQAAFTGGEISPKLVGRVDSDLYKKSLKYCSDFMPLPYGSLLMRGGTRYQLTPGGLTPDCRIIEFPVTGMQSKSLVLGNNLVRVYDENGHVQNGSTDFVKNGRFLYDWQHWTTRDMVVEGNRRFFGVNDMHIDGSGPAIWQTVPVTPGTYTIDVGVNVPSGFANLRVQIGTTPNGNDLLNITDPGSSIYCPLYQYSFTVPALCTTVYLSVFIFGSHIAEYTSPGGNQVSAELVSIAIPQGATGAVEFVSPWTDAQLADLQYVPDASKDRLLFAHPNVQPYELAFDQATGVWTLSALTFTQPATARWGTGDYQYPAAIELYDGRLWFGGVPGKVNTLLASKAGDILDFTISSPPVASDAIELKLSTKGEILWIQGARSLLIGTDKGEVSVAGAPISALDFQARPESAFGSAPIQGIAVGDQVVYFSRDRRKVRTLNFNLQENGFQSRDISFVAEHLTRNLIVNAAWAQDPNDTFVVLLADGKLVACVYNRAEQVVAWYRMDVGTVYSIMSANGPLGSELRLLVQRGSDVCLERLPMYEDGDPFNFDSCVIAPVTARVANVGTRFAGQTVGVLYDSGITHPDVTVDGSGNITLDVDASLVYAGIRFRPKAVLLPVEGGGAKGTTQGAKRRRVRLYLKLNDSAIPLVNGERPFPDRSIATPLDSPEQRTTGDVMTNMLGFDDGGSITIEQDVAIRTEILAVFGSVEVSES
jgi:hypothetical protein